jgi:hypothetical protein
MPGGVCRCCKKHGLTANVGCINHLKPHLGLTEIANSHTCSSCGFILNKRQIGIHKGELGKNKCIVSNLPMCSDDPGAIRKEMLQLWREKEEVTARSGDGVPISSRSSSPASSYNPHDGPNPTRQSSPQSPTIDRSPPRMEEESSMHGGYHVFSIVKAATSGMENGGPSSPSGFQPISTTVGNPSMTASEFYIHDQNAP